MSSLGTETVGGYQISQLLAAGGMAEIYLARKIGPGGFEKRVVLKRIAKKLLGDKEIEAMFLDEARVQALLDHPHVVQIHDMGVDKGSYWIAMEFVSGATLRWVIDNANAVGRPVPISHALRVVGDVLNGLHYAHELSDHKGRPLGLIHRDISPVNVLVSRAGCAKLCDFGVAKSRLQSVMTRVGIVKGKFRYMAPEQVNAAPLDRRADIFAVGAVLWEILAGRRLFDQQPEDAVVDAIRSGEYPSVREFRPEVPRAVDRVIKRALDPEPERRFASARDFQMATEELLRLLPESCNAAVLGEYLVAELEGTAGLEPPPKNNNLPDESGLLAANFELLDPPLPDASAAEKRRAEPTRTPQPTREVSEIREASAGMKLLAALLMAPALIFALPAEIVRGVAGLFSRDKQGA
ncbi:MAG: serine/threonine-protein kinase [Myxococcota bacterium]